MLFPFTTIALSFPVSERGLYESYIVIYFITGFAINYSLACLFRLLCAPDSDTDTQREETQLIELQNEAETEAGGFKQYGAHVLFPQVQGLAAEAAVDPESASAGDKKPGADFELGEREPRINGND